MLGQPCDGLEEILLVASCYMYLNRDKLRTDGPLGSYLDLTLYWMIVHLDSYHVLKLYFSMYMDLPVVPVVAVITSNHLCKLRSLALRTSPADA